jgi:hypothetical protein
VLDLAHAKYGRPERPLTVAAALPGPASGPAQAPAESGTAAKVPGPRPVPLPGARTSDRSAGGDGSDPSQEDAHSRAS